MFGIGGNQRYAALSDRVLAITERLDAQRAQLDRQRERIRTHKERLDTQNLRLIEVENASRRLTTLHDMIEHQMASMETRMDLLAARLEPDSPESSPAEREEARKLIDEIRSEHARIRTRFGVMARYEERIRRLEVALEPEPSHP